MSASILYRPIEPDKDRSLGVSAPSSFLEIMGKCFGEGGPWLLRKADIPILQGMAAACNHNPNSFEKIIEHIETYGAIEVWAEY